jgi:spore germination protein
MPMSGCASVVGAALCVGSLAAPVSAAVPPQPPRVAAAVVRFPAHAFVAYGTGFSGSASYRSFVRHVRQITVYAPWGFALTATGDAVERGGGAVAPVVAFAHAHGRLVMPLFTNAWTNDMVLVDPAVRSLALASLVRTVERYRLDGAVIDFEGLGRVDTAPLTTFVADAARRLHALGKPVLVAVGPQWEGESPAYAVYDYAALGRVADRVLLMTYDQHSNPGGPGPVAALPWVVGAVQEALATVPRDKVLLGIADYGYDWYGSAATTVTAAQALALARAEGVRVAWSGEDAEPNFWYVAGGLWHRVWFEDGRSVALRLALAARAGLGGVALWQLGGEGPGFWAAMARYRPAA